MKEGELALTLKDKNLNTEGLRKTIHSGDTEKGSSGGNQQSQEAVTIIDLCLEIKIKRTGIKLCGTLDA